MIQDFINQYLGNVCQHVKYDKSNFHKVFERSDEIPKHKVKSTHDNKKKQMNVLAPEPSI